MTRVALSLLLVALTASGAFAASSDDLSGLSNREYVEYARDRFEWLTGEGRSSHHLASKFHKQCKTDANADTRDADSVRACEIAKAADEQCDRVLQEGRDLLSGLQHRL